MVFNWKQLFSTGRNDIVGLDIGSSSVKMVQLLKEDKGYRAAAVGRINIKENSEYNQCIKQYNTIKAIRQCHKSTRTKTAQTIAGVSGPEVAVKGFDFPALPEEEIEQAVKLEAIQVCPFEIQHSTIDYHIMSSPAESRDQNEILLPEDRISGLMVAVSNKVLQSRRQLIKDANLKCILVDVDSLALINCFTEQQSYISGQTMAILNIGHSYTNLIILSEGKLPFIRDLPYAAVDIVEQMADEYNLPHQTIIENLYDPQNANNPDNTIQDKLENTAQKLINEIDKTLRYFVHQEKVKPVENIFACGGFSLVAGFMDILNKRLPGDTSLWNPFDKITYDSNTTGRDIIDDYGPALAVACGLAMRCI